MPIENPTIATAKESVTNLGVREKSGIVGGRSLTTHEKLIKKYSQEKKENYGGASVAAYPVGIFPTTSTL